MDEIVITNFAQFFS